MIRLHGGAGRRRGATCARLRELVGASEGLAGVQELETMAEPLAARDAAAVIDPAVVRGSGTTPARLSRRS